MAERMSSKLSSITQQPHYVHKGIGKTMYVIQKYSTNDGKATDRGTSGKASSGGNNVTPKCRRGANKKYL